MKDKINGGSRDLEFIEGRKAAKKKTVNLDAEPQRDNKFMVRGKDEDQKIGG